MEILAGAEGFEPPKAVLETAGLPLAYAPVSCSPKPNKILRTALKSAIQRLLCFSMRLMLSAKRAELLHLQTLRGRAFVLGFAVVAIFAFAALKLNDLSWHDSSLI